ncbi:hypothetical protein [Lacihabitans lacunae]|uniref:Lysoplasmalogenase n=1 Tax=Lacihabitans lacunae TaxID=1028214 RepID=A0ABV7YVY7_9BACT
MNSSNKTSIYFLVYLMLTFIKIHYQIIEKELIQVFILLCTNTLLWVYMFDNKDTETKGINYAKLFLAFITLGETYIIFYKNMTFLRLGMMFYLFSRLSLLLIISKGLTRFKLYTPFDYLKVFGPFVSSFILCFFTYNQYQLDFSLVILIISYGVIGSLLVSFLFYQKQSFSNIYLITAILFFTIHDALGGFSFFNYNFDPTFTISYILIALGNGLFALWFKYTFKTYIKSQL